MIHTDQMMGYQILVENLPTVLKNQPRWKSCLMFLGATLVITFSAVIIGVFFGYTYCYLEYHVEGHPPRDNATRSTTNSVERFQYSDSEEAKYNRTINGGLKSRAIMLSKYLKIIPHDYTFATNTKNYTLKIK